MAKQAQQPKDLAQEKAMGKRLAPLEETPDKLTIRRPARVQLSPEETRARMEAFTTEREEDFVAAVREDES